MLHVADVSNAMKPFELSKQWARRVVDEFFKQGDEEKRLGIPVGCLNDRDKINLPGSQHGFINFLVAPLVVGVVRVFQQLCPLATELSVNFGCWRDLWIAETAPSHEEIAKRGADVDKVKADVDTLTARTAKSL